MKQNNRSGVNETQSWFFKKMNKTNFGYDK